MLPSSPPKYDSWAKMVWGIRQDEEGWRVYALQAALNTVGRVLDPDGIFAMRTKRAVTQYQERWHLAADGIAGARTQAKLIEQISHKVHLDLSELPDGLLRGYAEAEGANILAATNWFTPPGGTPGCDCGVVQWRQYGPPFAMSGLRRSFDCEMSLSYAGRVLLDRMTEYRRRRSSLKPDTLLRIAILAHNAPFLADQVVRNGKLSTPDTIAYWTTKPGGGHYTHQEWYHAYPDRVMKYTTET